MLYCSNHIFQNLLEKWEDDIIEISTNQVNLRKNYAELVEMYYVLDHIGPMLGDAEAGIESKSKRCGNSVIKYISVHTIYKQY